MLVHCTKSVFWDDPWGIRHIAYQLVDSVDISTNGKTWTWHNGYTNRDEPQKLWVDAVGHEYHSDPMSGGAYLRVDTGQWYHRSVGGKRLVDHAGFPILDIDEYYGGGDE